MGPCTYFEMKNSRGRYNLEFRIDKDHCLLHCHLWIDTHWRGYIRQMNRLNLSMLCNRSGHTDKILYFDLQNMSVDVNIDHLLNTTIRLYGDKPLNRKYKRLRLDR